MQSASLTIVVWLIGTVLEVCGLVVMALLALASREIRDGRETKHSNS